MKLPTWLVATIATFALSACGGGGGGADAPATPTFSFNPATVTASVPATTAATLTVGATINRPADFNNATAVYVTVLDRVGVLQPQVTVRQTSTTSYDAVLLTAASLSAGNYQGSLTVNVCRDSACASHYPGSPMQLPYNITVTPRG